MSREEELLRQRLRKLQRLREKGFDPYPPRAFRSHPISEARKLAEEGSGDEVAVAGRIIAARNMGKVTFLDLRDGTGKIQLYFRRDILGEERYSLLEDLDIGDFISARGPLFRTKTGEISVEVRSFEPLSKALRPLPEKWHGLTDVEKRYRQRYLDLIANERTRRTFLIRSKVISAIRRFMESRGFIEVETPILQQIPAGALARPFSTYFHALDQTLYLRIAPELHLKRLIVGGFDKVFEIGRVFRNEGISSVHNPEFTMMESYEAYADYNDVMRMVEEMISYVADEVLGTRSIEFEGKIIDLSPPWPRIPLIEAIKRWSGIDIREHEDTSSLAEAMRRRGIEVEERGGRAKLIDHLLSKFVAPNLLNPTFIIDYPVEMSPLAKRKPEDPSLVERFELFIGGMEVANAYTELNDPIEQRERLVEQEKMRAALGIEEAERLDEDFLCALEHGMPPTGGLGVGIDRLVMILTGHTSIREVILFPFFRPKERE